MLGYKLIEMAFPNVRVTLELADESYVRFLGSRPKGKFKRLPHSMWPKYRAGKIFFSSFLDALIC